jgi:hypothetical protein
MLLEKSGSWRGRMAAGLLAAAFTFVTVDAAGSDCCNCDVGGRETLSSSKLPCLFDYPEGWDAVVGDDGALASAVVGPQSCETSCPNGTPGMSVSFGKKPDSNADTMEAIWPKVMSVVGSGRCGDGTVTFFSPPGADPQGLIGGVKFYVSVAGKKYSGAATFTCGQPGGWLALRQLFIDTFRGNPSSSFPGG